MDELSVPGTEFWILYDAGVPAGYVHLQPALEPDGTHVEIRYFGLAARAIGRGLGGPLLEHGIDAAWTLPERSGLPPVTRVWVHTCSLDGPAPEQLPVPRAGGLRRGGHRRERGPRASRCVGGHRRAAVRLDRLNPGRPPSRTTRPAAAGWVTVGPDDRPGGLPRDLEHERRDGPRHRGRGTQSRSGAAADRVDADRRHRRQLVGLLCYYLAARGRTNSPTTRWSGSG
ncbi:MAG: GNAT family N-acetyltransferase [Micropruina sp.]